jgi:hypothetical protein
LGVAGLVATAGWPAAAAEGGENRVFPPRYTGDGVALVDPREKTKALPVNIHHWWGLINEQGRLILYPRFDWTDYSYQGYARAVVDDRTGYLKLNGEWHIPPRFPYADRFKNDYAIVGDGESFGFINLAGNFIVPMRLDGALRFREGFAAVQRGDRVGFINPAGKLAIDLRFARARSFHEGLAAVQAISSQGEPGGWGYINQRGNWQFQDQSGRIQTLGSFHDGLARVEVDGKWGYLNRRFKVEIEPRFQDARNFWNGLAAVKIDGKWGYLNRNGKMQIEPQFRFADDFGSDRSGKRILALVGTDLKRGYVNQTGSRGIRPQFEWARPFFRDVARVSQSPNFGYINSAGGVFWDPRAPLERIVNLTLPAQIKAREDEYDPGAPHVWLPPKRPPQDEPYPPEHRYQDVLPKPQE